MAATTDLHTRYQLLHGDPEAARAELDRLAHSAKEVVVVSACLVGVRCRWDGEDRQSDEIVGRFISATTSRSGVEILPLCPEVLAHLGVPRPAMKLGDDGRSLFDEHGNDMTTTVEAGARLADLFADKAGAKRALLKDRSPSCGVHKIHTLSGLVEGRGRFAARLAKRSLPLVSDED